MIIKRDINTNNLRVDICFTFDFFPTIAVHILYRREHTSAIDWLPNGCLLVIEKHLT